MVIDTTNMSDTDIITLMINNDDFKLSITHQMEESFDPLMQKLASLIIFASPEDLSQILNVHINTIKLYIPDEYKRSDVA